ncbi:hypothetical protein [Streptomyces sp. TLI_105]|uniref:hypothetical protein n=1 Tax=Streptomyces sp. TLI_105 TaxID=1881019 RepID=UPI00089CDAC3|nr:hypothetical protein [Streptomyces sp. TLI_105]SED80137.1 hypothetical protein SAMN05428939_6294 [Streptomyces sp. TLI_105]
MDRVSRMPRAADMGGHASGFASRTAARTRLPKVVNRFEPGPGESVHALFPLVPRLPKSLPLSRGTADGLRLPAA